MVAKHLNDVSRQLADFLEKVLPSLFADWWNKAVINCLTYQQQRRIEQNRIQSLGKLDLAALLRVLDQNWYQLSSSLNLSAEDRNYVKEMQTVRNRWAHATTEGCDPDDAYRDLDTMQRFSIVIGANDQLVQALRTTKAKIHSGELLSTTQEDGTAPQTEVHNSDTPKSVEFEPGQLVVIKSNPSLRGAVLSVQPGYPENRFNIYLEGQKQTFYASQLQLDNTLTENSAQLLCEQFHAYLTALQIRYPGLSTLYSLNAARVDFIPYQFRPVLKFIRSDRPRLLIADGVGVGKTIEAGLILRELQARREIRSVLIICPRPLITEHKWQKEMKRFEEKFTHLEGASLRYCINEMDLEGVWPEQHKRVIVPYTLFDEALLYGSGGSKQKRKKGLLDLDPPPRFDLVIVDEAHHIRNTDTFSHKAVRFFCDHAEAVVFLTATPIQLGSNDLFVLLNTLRPDLIIDQESFQHMAEPNPFINQAVASMRAGTPEWQSQTIESLDKAAATSWGQAILKHNPEFVQIRSQLTEGNVTNAERVKIISMTEAMHTFSGIINRTRRRDIGEFTIRKPETVVIPFTPEQQQLHDDLLKVQAEIFSKLHGDISVKFMMTTIRRQAASCLYGLAPFLEEILSRHLDELSWEEADDTCTVPQSDAVNSIQTQIQRILDRVRVLEPHDPKLEALRNIICDKLDLSNKKIMLFSSFRHTLQYLYKNLLDDGFRVGMIHGGTPDEERMLLRHQFEKPHDSEDCLDLLLFSEIGCEGLDYQFCDCIVNYDLPWNPMRIEQRIGRIDRNGQKSESVAIVNMVTPGTVDADIYERCLVRIGVFSQSLGDCEGILGEITREIKNIAENYELSEEEKNNKLQQLADNKIRLIQEQEELEQRQVELFGIRLPQDQMNKEIKEASSFWLSSASIQRLVTLYLQRICGREQDFILGEKALKTLRLSQESRNSLLHDFQTIPRQNTPVYRDWENWLKGGTPHLPVTFESTCAIQHPEAAFIMPLHPLVKQASLSFDSKQRVFTKLSVSSKEIPAGNYEFAIYQWRFHGIREDLILQPIAISELVTAQLEHLLETAVDLPDYDSENIPSTVWEALEAQHYKQWEDAVETHRQRTQKLAEYRRESLSTSHRARINLLDEQLRQASNEKIQKMRQSQIVSAEADYVRRIQDLDIAVERADIIAELVACGILYVKGK
ncbi:MAG: DEAD/DEAH box helicase family protein [SAR324 cluster bacterium]|nr:DEAD/DEAH box helicase family protein [SAR324 cluster bacterium]